MFLDVFQAKTESKWKQRLIFWDASFDQQFLLDEAETTSQSGLKKSCRSNPGHVRQDLKKNSYDGTECLWQRAESGLSQPVQSRMF